MPHLHLFPRELRAADYMTLYEFTEYRVTNAAANRAPAPINSDAITPDEEDPLLVKPHEASVVLIGGLVRKPKEFFLDHVASPLGGHTSVLSYTLMLSTFLIQTLDLEEGPNISHLMIILAVGFVVNIIYNLLSTLAAKIFNTAKHKFSSSISTAQMPEMLKQNIDHTLRFKLQIILPQAVNRAMIIMFIASGYFVAGNRDIIHGPLYSVIFATLVAFIMSLNNRANEAALYHLLRYFITDFLYKGLPIGTVGLLYGYFQSAEFMGTPYEWFNELCESLIYSLALSTGYSLTTIVAAIFDYFFSQQLYYNLVKCSSRFELLASVFTDLVILCADKEIHLQPSEMPVVTREDLENQAPLLQTHCCPAKSS